MKEKQARGFGQLFRGGTHLCVNLYTNAHSTVRTIFVSGLGLAIRR